LIDRPGGIHRLFNNEGVRRFLRRIRVPLFVAVAAILIWDIDPAWLLPAFCVSLSGELIQL